MIDVSSAQNCEDFSLKFWRFLKQNKKIIGYFVAFLFIFWYLWPNNVGEVYGVVQGTVDNFSTTYEPNIGEVDALITFVNGSHPIMKAYGKDEEDSRSRDNNELQFLLRSLDMHMPWIRNVYLLVMDERIVPEWIDQSKVKVITHKDIFGDLAALPTFSSCSIETQFGNLNGDIKMSDPFIYFNDDYFITKHIRKQDLFTKDGKGRLYYESSKSPGAKEYSSLRGTVATSPLLWDALMAHTSAMMDTISGEHRYNRKKHAPHVFSQKIIKELEGKFPQEFNSTQFSKERAATDFDPGHLYMWYSEHVYGYEHVSSVESNGMARLILASDKNRESNLRVIRAISRGKVDLWKPRFVTINDSGPRSDDFQDAILKEMFYMFPNKCKYEKK
eukprot:TRINITY_DN2176_c0_g1_i1.p1 TRINITY_DN2176_c0_g1~~TRINITY_DN2176_c0_g1_i1.p1  ORF type:complete len:388 (-),score=70.87 TRINITY_DN2176_c0_g1_i1:89-1252(-)